MIDFSSEIFYRTARSGGKGGQNVNKVETMVEALWEVAGSKYFTDEEKARILQKLATKLNKEGCLHTRSSETRSQLENKEIATSKLLVLVRKSLEKPKPRKATRPSKAVRERRLDSKKMDGMKKELRRPPSMD